MTIDTIETWLTWAIGGLLFLSALLSLIRITLGPSVLDRVVASDVLVSIVVCALGAYAALTDAWTTLPLLISLSLVGFMGSVAVARFVARDRDTPFVAPAPDRLQDGGSAPPRHSFARRAPRRSHGHRADRATPERGPGHGGGRS
ncbi:monovalent cation/H+ antiporter complex subunit F [Ornithinimicrobium sufpigmenti]|uniref:monovalent cation/H+ antiporter complex subunit F n=1 Tax=Ornithinimicrobium sufpigmenti TaxID=2508882 RepID=UPI0010357F3E|nr:MULTISPECIES: monovalent cation/H+ antiporter complex subunit F [unclassified Ornithinimicrobium]